MQPDGLHPPQGSTMNVALGLPGLGSDPHSTLDPHLDPHCLLSDLG